jgi:hypothetical protein
MKKIIPFLSMLVVLELRAQPQFNLSTNIYRVPYANNKDISVLNDVYTHSPVGRYDLRAQGADNCSTHVVVAAAAGVVRNVVENNTASCGSCGASNNYVWIQHLNGEWTKYTHFAQNSVVVNVGDTVCAGATLGFECWVGATIPDNFRHLHFEVRRPNDPVNPPIIEAGGFLAAADGEHLIPVTCGITDNYYIPGQDVTSGSCSTCPNVSVTHSLLTVANGAIKITLASSTVNAGTNVNFQNGANGFFRAGNSITFTPGFTASAGSYFNASIGSCRAAGFPPVCSN